MIQIQDIGYVRRFRLARTILGRNVYYTAAYWVDGLMIDTGCSYTVRDLITGTEDLTIEQILITHSHEDHIGANTAFQRRLGVEIASHPLGLPVLAAPREQQPLKLYQLLMWGYPDPSKGTAIGDLVQTKNHCFQVIHTPGHSPDHICLYEPDQGWLFSGDAYIGGRDRALRADYNIWQIISSLKKLAQLDVGLLFTGSGRVRENGRADLLEKISYLEEMGAQALELYQQGLSYSHIRRKLFGRELPISYLTMGHFSGKHLVRSFIQDQPATSVSIPIS